MIAKSKTIGALCLLLLAGFLTGCGQRGYTPAKVRGVVKYNGAPLKGGLVTFHSADKGSYNASIAQDGSGTYEAIDLPLGELDVTVQTEFLNPHGTPNYGGGKSAKIDKEYASAMASMKGGGGGGGPTGGSDKTAAFYTKIPAKYAKPGTSKLTVTLTNGWNDFNFDLTD